MKKLLRTALNKCGFDIIRTKNDHDDLAKHLANVLHSREIDCVFDVGANSGQYGMFLRELGYRGYIISFEPVNAVFRKLKETSKGDDKWLCFDYALGDKNESKVINVYKSTVFSSFLTANDYSKNIWHSLEDVVPETVQVRRLGDIWNEVIGSLTCRNYMLKLDTQGFDKFAFEGARDRLRDISVLQSELSLIPVYEGMAEVYDVLKEYNSCDYFISGMYPINRDQSLAVIEYDCVMVKRKPE
jgi:FkbM family methyltransferase